MVYNISGGQPENLLDYISTLQEELVRAGVLPADYEFKGHREWVILMNDHIPTTKISEILREEFILGSEKNAVYAFRTGKIRVVFEEVPGIDRYCKSCAHSITFG